MTLPWTRIVHADASTHERTLTHITSISSTQAAVNTVLWEDGKRMNHRSGHLRPPAECVPAAYRSPHRRYTAAQKSTSKNGLIAVHKMQSIEAAVEAIIMTGNPKNVAEFNAKKHWHRPPSGMRRVSKCEMFKQFKYELT